MRVTANPHIAILEPYPLADSGRGEAEPPLSLAQNESFAGPSPKAQAAARAALEEARLYADPDWRDLRRAIAAVHDIPAEQILCAGGSMDLIAALALAYLGPDRRALAGSYGYLFFRNATNLAGAAIDLAPERDFALDLEALLAAVRPDTRVVFVADPGNPTGTYRGRAWLLRLRAALPSSVLLVVDQAYGEFADAPGEAVFDLVEQGNTVVLRTFSKAYGLAGLRSGWGLFPPEVAREVGKLLTAGNPAAPCQAAATAAMEDQAYLRAVVAETGRRRDAFAARLRTLGFEVPESRTNFVLIVFRSPAAAAEADAALRAAGIVLRTMGGYGLPHCLRATIGPEDAMETVLHILESLSVKAREA
ncbi:MAG: histidinol-phosphate transaminase [Rhodospirillales bacterium]